MEAEILPDYMPVCSNRELISPPFSLEHTPVQALAFRPAYLPGVLSYFIFFGFYCESVLLPRTLSAKLLNMAEISYSKQHG